MYTKVSCMLMSVGLFWILGVVPVFGAQPETAHQIYQQVIEKLESLSPGETIEVRMGTAKDQYDVGEPFEVRFQTSQDCYMVLMSIAAGKMNLTSRKLEDGDITFLFPYYRVLDNRIEGGRVYSTWHDFGLKLNVAPPYGYDTLNLFCSAEKVDLFEADFTREKVYTIKSDDEQRLQDLLNRLEQLEQTEWSGTSVSFYIQGGRGSGSKFGGLPPIGSTGSTGKSNGNWFPPIGSTGSTGKR